MAKYRFTYTDETASAFTGTTYMMFVSFVGAPTFPIQSDPITFGNLASKNSVIASLKSAINGFWSMAGVSSLLSIKSLTITEASQSISLTMIVDVDDSVLESSNMTLSNLGQIIQSVALIDDAYQYLGNPTTSNTAPAHLCGCTQPTSNVITLKQLYLDIKSKLESMTNIKFVQVWNNQLQYNNDGEHYNYPMPCVFVEMANASAIEQLGNGYQLINIIVRLHIIHEFYNATDGYGIEEQDLTIFDLRDSVYFTMQKFEPNGAVKFVRTSESQDYEHNNVYHFIQEYTTNLIDNMMEEPIGYIDKLPPTDYAGQITLSETYQHQA